MNVVSESSKFYDTLMSRIQDSQLSTEDLYYANLGAEYSNPTALMGDSGEDVTSSTVQELVEVGRQRAKYSCFSSNFKLF